MRPTVKVFTKDSPCTKRDLWECFAGETGFRTVALPEAHSVIGVNAPRGMERMGRIALKRTPQGEYYSLTSEGREWLKKGILAYLKNHPAERGEIRNLHLAEGPTVRIRRTR